MAPDSRCHPLRVDRFLAAPNSADCVSRAGLARAGRGSLDHLMLMGEFGQVQYQERGLPPLKIPVAGFHTAK